MEAEREGSTSVHVGSYLSMRPSDFITLTQRKVQVDTGAKIKSISKDSQIKEGQDRGERA